MRTVDAAGLRIGDGQPPRVMGVLNVSRESPYDPSVYDDPGDAAAYVDEALVDEGAEIVDVGLESANKRLDVLTAAEELERLDVAVDAIESVSGDAVFSIETRYAEVARAALERGFDMVNDVCGFADPEMPAVCREYDAAVVKMASPPDLARPGAVDDVDWASVRSPAWADRAGYVDMVSEALERNGMTEKTILDPAFGGWSETKTLADDRETFRRLREFRGFGRPLLVSINRKNFLRAVADRSTEDALAVSLAATSLAVERGAHVVRTHDVAETRDAALVGHELAERTAVTAGVVSAEGVTATELDVSRPAELAGHLERLGADPGAADALVGRVVEVSGLSASGSERLADAAERAGALVCPGTDGLVIGGTAEALAAMAESLSSSRFEPVVDVLAADVGGG